MAKKQKADEQDEVRQLVRYLVRGDRDIKRELDLMGTGAIARDKPPMWKIKPYVPDCLPVVQDSNDG